MWQLISEPSFPYFLSLAGLRFTLAAAAAVVVVAGAGVWFLS
jgi:hypothetical protein